jgi:chaperonin GroEL (HSP60 family)
VKEGILPGGAVALLRAGEALKRVRTQNDDQKTGVEIVRKALSWPARQIAINAGEDGSITVRLEDWPHWRSSMQYNSQKARRSLRAPTSTHSPVRRGCIIVDVFASGSTGC